MSGIREPAASNSYHTAYRGTRIGPDGKFSNFIRSPDESHIRNGYWRFACLEDDQRAYARGYHTPEDILLAVNRGEGPYDDILLRWVPGTFEMSMTGLTGNARQQLKEIYDIRRYLGRNLSMRGQVPTYPIDPNLKPYWDARYAAVRQQERPAGIATSLALNTTTPSPLTTHEGRQTAQPSISTQKIVQSHPQTPPGSDGAANSMMCTQPPPTPAASTNSSPVESQETTRQLSQSQRTSIAQGPRGAGNNIPTMQGYRPRVGPQYPITPGHGVSGAQNTLNTPSQQAPKLGQTPGVQPTSSTKQPTQRRTGAVPHVKPSVGPPSGYHLQSPQQSRTPVPAPGSLPASQVTGSRPNLVPLQPSQASRSFDSPFAPLTGNAKTPPSSTSKVTLSLPAQRAQELAKQYGATNPLLPRKPLPSDIIEPRTHSSFQQFPPRPPPSLTRDHHPSAAAPSSTASGLPAATVGFVTTRNPATAIGAQVIGPTHKRPTSSLPATTAGSRNVPDTPKAAGQLPSAVARTPYRVAAPQIITRQAGAEDTSWTNDGLDQGFPDEGVTPAAGEPLHGRVNPPKPSVAPPQAIPLKRSLAPSQSAPIQRKKLKGNDQEALPTTPSQEVLLPPASPDMDPGLPCIDCGEDTGHKWDCHIGNLKPMANLTVLDYRNLAENVEYFDPGPWTTHYVSPTESEPEDSAIVTKGMAEIIRNEDTYKANESLRALPDELMMLQWALQTSPNVEVFECKYDSGIGESEGEQL